MNTLALMQITVRLPSETVALKDLNNNATRRQSITDNEVTPESKCIGHTESDCRRISHGFYTLYCMCTGINYTYSLTQVPYAFRAVLSEFPATQDGQFPIGELRQAIQQFYLKMFYSFTFLDPPAHTGKVSIKVVYITTTCLYFVVTVR